MAKVGLFELSLFFMLPFTAESSPIYSITVGYVHSVALLCPHEELHGRCDRVTWLYSLSEETYVLFENGKVHEDAGVRSARLSVALDCSLVIKTVTAVDNGFYTCRYFISGEQFADAEIQLTSVADSEGAAALSTVIPGITGTTPQADTAQPTTDESSTADRDTKTGCWWRIVYVPVGLAALSIVVVWVNVWSKSKCLKSYFDKTIKSSKRRSEEEDVVNYENVDPSAAAGLHSN